MNTFGDVLIKRVAGKGNERGDKQMKEWSCVANRFLKRFIIYNSEMQSACDAS